MHTELRRRNRVYAVTIPEMGEKPLSNGLVMHSRTETLDIRQRFVATFPRGHEADRSRPDLTSSHDTPVAARLMRRPLRFRAKLMLEPSRAELLGAMADGTLAGTWCLHLGTHGYSMADKISENAPLESMLELADGSVDGYEIAAADLRCEIVVLTACDSGNSLSVAAA